MRLENFPPGVQCLLKDAVWHLEQLGLLEREFRAWQMTQGETGTAAVCIIDAQGREIELFRPTDHFLPRASLPVASGIIEKLTAPPDRPKFLTD